MCRILNHPDSCAGFSIRRSFVSSESQRITQALVLMSKYAFQLHPHLKTEVKEDTDHQSISTSIPSALEC